MTEEPWDHEPATDRVRIAVLDHIELALVIGPVTTRDARAAIPC